MNYDFKSNWNDIVLPLLDLPIVKKSIKKGITDYINDGNCYDEITYDSNQCPANYERGDGWDCYIDEYKEKLIEKLIATGMLKEDKNEPKDEEDFDEYFNGSDKYEEYCIYVDKVLNPFLKYHEKTSLRAYQMFGACHWWNPTFCLTLAKLIYPNEKWIIKKGFYHTTVVNFKETLVFDILYFNENDITFGGEFAISEASKIELK